jgi:predicted dehydrogenase
MTRKIRWGVLGAAKIAIEKVIPAMQAGTLTEVTAIASRDLSKAQAAAARLGLAKAYGSYEELLADPDVDAIYNPLPNHLHVPWSIRAAEAGKHVLCEKPVSLTVDEAKELLAARDRAGVVIGEAFMARSNPQWLRARDIVRFGQIGDLRLIGGFFSYFNADPANIRNQADIGGGAMMDIGCYPITLSRLIFNTEPTRVFALIERDPALHTDRLSSAILDYVTGQCVFSCSTQLVPYQRMHLMGTKGRVEIEIPFNAPPDRPNRIYIDDGSSVFGTGIVTEDLPVSNQYTVQGDLFSKSILDGTPAPTTLEDAVRNMAVIQALFQSAESGRWEYPSDLL